MNRAVACSIAAMTRSSLEYWLHSCCRYMKWYFQSVFTVDNDDVGKHVNCGSLSRDAKKIIGDGGRALRIAKKPRAATATSDSQLHLLVTPLNHITSVKMAGLLGKKFPTPVGMLMRPLRSLGASKHRTRLLTLWYSPPHGTLLHCRFVSHMSTCAISGFSDIDILFLSGAIIFYGINSLATTLANSQSTYSHTCASPLLAASPWPEIYLLHREQTANELYHLQPTSTATTPATPTRTLSPPTRYDTYLK